MFWRTGDVPGHAQSERDRVGTEVFRNSRDRAAVVLEAEARFERHAIVNDPSILRVNHRATCRGLRVIAGPVLVRDHFAVQRRQPPTGRQSVRRSRRAHARTRFRREGGAGRIAAVVVMAEDASRGDRRSILVPPERVAAVNARLRVLRWRRTVELWPAGAARN